MIQFSVKTQETRGLGKNARRGINVFIHPLKHILIFNVTLNGLGDSNDQKNM